MKRKRPSSSQDSPIHKKPKPRLQQRPTRQYRPYSKPYRRSSKSVAPVSSTEGRLPSPPLSVLYAADTDMSPDCCNLGRLSGVALLTLTEVTFRLYSLYCCSFTTVIRDGCAEQEVSFSQVVRLITSIGYIAKINDFIIKSIE
jgi:hypothetical protein